TQLARDLGHLSPVAVESEANHVSLVFLQLTDMTAFRHCRNADRHPVPYHGAGQNRLLGADHRRGAGWQFPFGELRCRGDPHLIALDEGGNLGEILDCKPVALAEYDGAKYGVLELADIAGPAIGLEHFEGLGRDAMDF